MAPDEVPLGDLARARQLLFGIAVDFAKHHAYDSAQGGGFYDPVYREIVLREKFNILAYDQGFVFGNAAALPPDKSGHLVFEKDGFNAWYEVDDSTPLMKASGARVRADSLIWNNAGSTPNWLKPLPKDDSWEKSPAFRFNLQAMEMYLEAAYAKLYEISADNPLFVHSIGLVNEPIEHRPGAGSIWANGPLLSWRGTPPLAEATRLPTYLRRALTLGAFYRKAKAPAGRSPLTSQAYINDTSDGTNPACLQMVDLIQKEGLELDAIGLECHWQPGQFENPARPDWSLFGKLLADLGRRGLEVYITELDVLDYWASCQGHTASPQESDALTSVYYRSFMETVLRYPCVKMVTCFTPFDRYSWYRELNVADWMDLGTFGPSTDAWPRCPRPPKPHDIACPRPGLYDELMRSKSTRQAIAEALRGPPL